MKKAAKRKKQKRAAANMMHVYEMEAATRANQTSTREPVIKRSNQRKENVVAHQKKK